MAVTQSKPLKLYYKYFFFNQKFFQEYLNLFDIILDVFDNMVDKNLNLDINGEPRNIQEDLVFNYRYKILSRYFSGDDIIKNIILDLKVTNQEFLELLVALRCCRLDFNYFNAYNFKNLINNSKFDILFESIEEEKLELKSQYLRVLVYVNISFDPINVYGDFNNDLLILEEPFDLLLKLEKNEHPWIAIKVTLDTIEKVFDYCASLENLSDEKKIIIRDLLLQLFMLSMYEKSYFSVLFTRKGKYSLNVLGLYIDKKIKEPKYHIRASVNTMELRYPNLISLIEAIFVNLDNIKHLPFDPKFKKKPRKGLKKATDYVSEFGLFDKEEDEVLTTEITDEKPKKSKKKKKIE